jgi:alpha-L-fucosidase
MDRVCLKRSIFSGWVIFFRQRSRKNKNLSKSEHRMMHLLKKLLYSTLLLVCSLSATGQEQILNLNQPGREAWFSNLGFGMFIHWSFDAQLGMVISHSMVGASADYLDRYIHKLPKSFNPVHFDAAAWARAAKMAGMKYVVFTTKHHNGFCMFDTETTDFSIMHTPYARDITRMVVEAFRREGLAIGFYYSPDDFYFLHQQGLPVSRARPEALASHNPALNAYCQEQVTELMTRYGPVDIVFLDGLDQFSKTELAKVCWDIQPGVVVTRGAMETPEQETPDAPLPAPWEACYTLGDQWQFRPTNEHYKSALETIIQLIEIRAKGGNFLLNFGPGADGDFPPDQWGILNELSLWMFINREAFERTGPCPTIREDNVWFLKHREEQTVFAFVLEDQWELGERKTYSLKSLRALDNPEISVLGHGGKILEYHPEADPSPTLTPISGGIEISVMRAQRIYNDRKWPNPLVIKLEGVTFSNK